LIAAPLGVVMSCSIFCPLFHHFSPQSIVLHPTMVLSIGYDPHNQNFCPNATSRAESRCWRIFSSGY
jgi:hypothetical protein